MSVLLRQPHGFEGLGAVAVSPHQSHDLRISNCPDLEDPRIHIYAAPLPLPPHHDRGYDSVPRIDQLSSSPWKLSHTSMTVFRHRSTPE